MLCVVCCLYCDVYRRLIVGCLSLCVVCGFWCVNCCFGGYSAVGVDMSLMFGALCLCLVVCSYCLFCLTFDVGCWSMCVVYRLLVPRGCLSCL